jgi:hypothetical protein
MKCPRCIKFLNETEGFAQGYPLFRTSIACKDFLTALSRRCGRLIVLVRTVYDEISNRRNVIAGEGTFE